MYYSLVFFYFVYEAKISDGNVKLWVLNLIESQLNLFGKSVTHFTIITVRVDSSTIEKYTNYIRRSEQVNYFLIGATAAGAIGFLALLTSISKEFHEIEKDFDVMGTDLAEIVVDLEGIGEDIGIIEGEVATMIPKLDQVEQQIRIIKLTDAAQTTTGTPTP